MTRYEALIHRSWREQGLSQVIVARIHSDGRADVGVFLVDLWCLGVKDAFLHDAATEAEFRELLEEQLPEEFRERIHPACAKKLIDGAVAYAESLGIAPHRDYRKARRALGGLDAGPCPETFTYGRDGRPCYVEGPDDSLERTERVLAILEARCGPDGFDFDGYEVDEDEAEFEDAREELLRFFAHEPDGSPTFQQLAGMVAAMHICPGNIPPAEILRKLWRTERVWADEAEIRSFLGPLQVYWNYMGDVIAECTEDPLSPTGANPIDIDSAEFEDPRLVVTAQVEWARGFLLATEAWPDAWDDSLERSELAASWSVLRAWADPDVPGNLEILLGKNQEGNPGPGITDAVNKIMHALRPLRRTTS